jgi:hypothetical protein
MRRDFRSPQIPMITAAHLANCLVAAITAAEWSPQGTQAALRRVLVDAGGGRPAERLAQAIHAGCASPVCPPPADLRRVIRGTDAFFALLDRLRELDRPLPAVLDGPSMAPLPPFRDLDLPELATSGDLADWLGLLPRELDWFADADGRLARRAPAERRHYACDWQPKRRGGQRLIEAPKPRLRQLQRRILRGILDLVPPHPSAFGFIRGRNCLQGAQRHAGEEVVVCLDLRDFFLGIPASRIHALYRALGFPWHVARLLTGLCTVTAPPEVLAALSPEQRHRALPGRALAGPHLPQGAPTSPALANLAAWRLDRRLDALARRSGAAYSRYADDITFSGPRSIAFDAAQPLVEIVAEIVAEEGFAVNSAKTRIQRAGGRQMVTGVVVNRHLNVPRRDYDRLKAILTNCRRHGPPSQNRAGHPAFRTHLDGRVTWVETVNPARGARLRELFEAVDWNAVP